ncbi:hypothetical protein [Endozoicomonas acroporae]|uniref:hypothetical protein n=1 Tax=Endozoicomonas acroporae TaxID=1701104 RepID=UPI0013CFF8A1|nr:hypothetical protein [Endozoicomonas acroporae]
MTPSGVQCFCNDLLFPSKTELKQHIKEKHLLPAFSSKSVSFFEKDREIPPSSDSWEQVNRLEMAKRICIELMDSEPKDTDLSLDHIRRCTRLIQREISTIKLKNNCSSYSSGMRALSRRQNPETFSFLEFYSINIHDVVAIAFNGSSMHCTTTASSDIDLYIITKNTRSGKSFFDFNLDTKRLSKKYQPEIRGTCHRFEKSTEKDIDAMICSLPVFIWQCLNSNPAALDLLHISDELVLYEGSDGFFSELREHKDAFYTKFLPYTGFAKDRIRKLKAVNPEELIPDKERLDRLSDLIKTLKMNIADRLEDILENVDDFDELIARNTDKSLIYSIAGLQFDAGIKVKRVIRPLENQLKKIKEGATNNKKLSTVIRLITQIKELYTNGHFEYPLPNSTLMMNLKSEASSDEDTKKVDEMINEFLAQHKEWSKNSRFADRVDKDFWKTWLEEKSIDEER